MDRRGFLKALGAVGGLIAARPLGALASTPLGGGTGPAGAARTSKLAASQGLMLAHTDLHNHSLISGDADGDPYGALTQMKNGGLDVACLTEHAISGKDHGEITCPGWHKGGCDTVEGINETDWAAMAQIADASYVPGTFVSFRAFEYSTPTIGHLNVWFSTEFTDALHEFAFFTPPAAAEIDRVAPVPSEIVDNFEKAPDIATMKLFYDWLASPPGRDVLGGGNDGIACFNHPNEFGNFDHFTYEPRVAANIVSCEALNADRDFFWFDLDKGKPNPLDACLNAGWRVGFTGVSDEHSTVYARDGMARGGLWLTELTREAVKTALESRRTFATYEPGLRLDATANGAPMGSVFAHASGTITIELDVDRGPSWEGKRLYVEVVRPGPSLARAPIAIDVPAAGADPISFDVSVDRSEGDWLFLRILDPSRPAHPLAVPPFDQFGGVVAYASPWFLT